MDHVSTPKFSRPYAGELLHRLKEPRRFLQVITGARQVGKTTMVEQVSEQSWRRYRARRDQRRAQREQDLNVFVELTTGELIHRGCAGRKDEIEREGLIPLGRCVRCGEHGRSPRA